MASFTNASGTLTECVDYKGVYIPGEEMIFTDKMNDTANKGVAAYIYFPEPVPYVYSTGVVPGYIASCTDPTSCTATATPNAPATPGTYRVAFRSCGTFEASGYLCPFMSVPIFVRDVGDIYESSNIPSYWTITGPVTFTDGTNGSSTNGLGSYSSGPWKEPSGTYTITWGAKSGYVTPATQTLTLGSGGTISFRGTYTASPTATISQSSASTYSGTPYNITWNSTNADNCTLVETNYNGSSHTGTVMPYGRMDLSTTIPGTYVDTISCTRVGVTSAPVSVTHIVTTACNLPWGGAIPGSQSVTAYQSSSVISPATCTSETRTCINYVPAIYTVGVLSGSYVYQSCTVAPPAPTLTLSASPNPAAYNAASTLSWTTSNATSCWATNGWTGWKTNTGGSESTGALTATKAYSLQCWNSAGVSTGVKIGTVNVNAAPILTLSVAPNPVAYGAASTLSWTTSNATSCWASNGWTGWKTNTGGSESTGALAAAKIYSLQCWNSAGASTGVKTGTVNVNAAPTPVTTFNSSSLNLPAGGGNITLSWSVASAVPGTCTGYSNTNIADWALGGTGGKPTNGNIPVAVTESTTFNLDCWNTVVSPWIPAARTSVTVNVCVPNCNNSDSYCAGDYTGNCGQTCAGTRPQYCPGGWSDCSKSCGGGIQTRQCDCPPFVKTQGCNSQPCPPGYREVAPW